MVWQPAGRQRVRLKAQRLPLQRSPLVLPKFRKVSNRADHERVIVRHLIVQLTHGQISDRANRFVRIRDTLQVDARNRSPFKLLT